MGGGGGGREAEGWNGKRSSTVAEGESWVKVAASSVTPSHRQELGRTSKHIGESLAQGATRRNAR